MTVRKSLAWSLFGQIASFSISFLGSIIIARLLTPLELGVYAVASAIIGVIGVIANVGIGSYLIREIALTQAKIQTAFTLNAIISLSLSIIIFLASFAGNLLFDDNQVGIVIRLLAVPPLIGVIEFLPSTMVQRDMQFGSKSVVLVLSTLIGVVVTLISAYLGFSSLSFAFSAIAVALFRAIAMTILVPHHVNYRLRFTDWRPIFVFGYRMVLITGAAQLAQRLSEVILGSLLGLSTLGIYARASNLANLVFYNLYGSATGVVFSQLSLVYRETGVVNKTFIRGLQMIIAFMWPLMIGMAILSRPLINTLYGPKWSGAAIPFSLLMISQVIVLSFGMNWELFVLKDRTAEQTKLEIFRSFSGLILFTIGCYFNIIAASLGRVFDSFVGAMLYLPRMSQLADVSAADLVRVYRDAALLTFVTVGPSFVLMLSNQWSSQTSPVLVSGAVVMGGVIWLTTLRIIRHPLFDEISRLWRSKALAPSSDV